MGAILKASVYKKNFVVRLNLSRTKTNTGGLGEYPKTIERRMFKEFGKKTTRNFGRWVAVVRRWHLKFTSRLFIKNTCPCKAEKHGIGADACPVLVS